jgi:hypothetical protein
MNYRAALVGGINKAVRAAIEHDDQKFGRQLATIFEKAALTLRAKFGGKTHFLSPTKKEQPKRLTKEQLALISKLLPESEQEGELGQILRHPDLADADRNAVLTVALLLRRARSKYKPGPYAVKEISVKVESTKYTVPLRS